ncbi:general substrate transporter [Aspergillus germanicus]
MADFRLISQYSMIVLAALLNLSPMSYDGNLINNLFLIQRFVNYYGINSSTQGLIVAIVSIGSFVIGPFAGPIVDGIGRKRSMALGSSLSVISVILQVSTRNVGALLFGRFLLGVAILVNISSATSLVMEIAHPKHRGLLMGLLMSLVFCVNIFVNVAGLGEGIQPALSLFLIPFLPESPRWLIYKECRDEALKILAQLHAGGDQDDSLVRTEYEEIIQTLEQERQTNGPWRALVRPASNLRRFTIAVLCAIFSQITGGYTIPYFQSLIITNAGITVQRSVLLLALGISIWTWAAMLIGTALVDKIGRKALFLGGTSLMTVAIAFMAGFGYAYEQSGKASYANGSVAMLFIFMGSMSSSWLVLSYMYPPEVLNFSQRAKGVGISQAIGYAFSATNQYVLPIAIARISWRYYAMVAGWNVVIILVMAWLFIETNKKTLEQVDQIFEGVEPADQASAKGLEEPVVKKI